MSAMRFPVAVIFERTDAREPLGERALGTDRGHSAGRSTPRRRAGAPAPVKISDDAVGAQWRFDGHAFELHPSEAEGYYLNLVAPEPKAFVMWRMREDGGDPPVFPVIVTVSYNEAARMLDGGERVDAVPLPDGILAWMRALRRRALQARTEEEGAAQRPVRATAPFAASADDERPPRSLRSLPPEGAHSALRTAVRALAARAA